MTTLSSRRCAAPFVSASILCLLAACASSGPAVQAGGHEKTVMALNDTQLGDIRGGFDVSPNLTVNFGFHQITAIDHNIVSSIVVPDMTISPLSNSSQFSSSGPLGGSFASPGKSGTSAGSSPGAQAAVPAIVTNPAGRAQPVSPAVQNSVVTSSQGQGVTTVMTQLGSGGLATIIGNTANNALIQQITTINLAISGLQPLLAQGRSNAALTNALSFGSAQFH